MRRRKRNYPRDPFWLNVKWAGKCASCGAALAKGERAFYYPNTKTLYGEKCCEAADEGSRALESAKFDEAVYTGGTL